MKTKIVGLTGGIGSGKTTIAKYFEEYGIPVYIADDEAKKILFNAEVVNEITTFFGEDILVDGLPDKKKIAEIVFKDSEKLKQLNTIIHPRVNKHFKEWVRKQKNIPFVIKEAAILFESGSFKDCDKIILVTAPENIRIERVMKRDNILKDEVLERMSKQWNDDKKASLSDFIINNIDLNNSKGQVDDIMHKLKKIFT